MSGLRKRILRVAVKLPGVTASNPNADPFDPSSGNVILDETLNLKVRIEKTSLAIQNKATIEVTNLLESVRQQLLSNFNQFRSAQLDNFGTTQPLAEVWIKAGYEFQNGVSTVAQIYHGEVRYTDLVSSPPNVTVDFTCFTHQVDRSTWLANTAPESMTFGDFVRWAGNQMGFDNGHIKCSTKYDAQIIENPARSISTVYQLLPYIQDWQHPDVAAFIDDDFLIVKDRYAILNPNTVSQLNEFIGIPSWTDYGVAGVVLLDPSIRLASAVQFTSNLNPSLNGKYVAMGLDYNLSSREKPFYVKVDACPPADSDNAVVQNATGIS